MQNSEFVDIEFLDRQNESSKSLLEKSLIPVVIYSKEKNIKKSVHVKLITDIYFSGLAYSKIFRAKIDNKETYLYVKTVQCHSVKDHIIHLDFMIFDGVQNVKCPILFKNKTNAHGVKKGGVLNMARYYLNIKTDINSFLPYIELDLIKLKLGEAIRINNVKEIYPNLDITDNETLIVASVMGRAKKEEANKEEASEETSS